MVFQEEGRFGTDFLSGNAISVTAISGFSLAGDSRSGLIELPEPADLRL